MKKNFIMCNQCVNQYEVLQGKRCEVETGKDIIDLLSKGSSEVLCEEKMRVQLLERLNVQEVN